MLSHLDIFKKAPDVRAEEDRAKTLFLRIDKAQAACLLLSTHLAQIKHAMLEVGACVPIDMHAHRGTVLPKVAVDDAYVRYLEVWVDELIQIGEHLARQTQ